MTNSLRSSRAFNRLTSSTSARTRGWLAEFRFFGFVGLSDDEFKTKFDGNLKTFLNHMFEKHDGEIIYIDRHVRAASGAWHPDTHWRSTTSSFIAVPGLSKPRLDWPLDALGRARIRKRASMIF